MRSAKNIIFDAINEFENRKAVQVAVDSDTDQVAGESHDLSGLDDQTTKELEDAGIKVDAVGDDDVVFSFALKYDPSKYDSTIVPKSDEQKSRDEIAHEDVQDFGDGEVDESDSYDVPGDSLAGKADKGTPASQSHAEDAAPVGASAVAQQCAATFQQCQAKNPYACRYHGLKLMEGDLNAELANAGVQNAKVTIKSMPHAGTFSVAVKCKKSEAKAVGKAIAAFSKKPGIDTQSLLDVGFMGSDYKALYDVDGLNPAASSASTTHSSTPTQATRKPRAKKSAPQAATTAKPTAPQHPNQAQATTTTKAATTTPAAAPAPVAGSQGTAPSGTPPAQTTVNPPAKQASAPQTPTPPPAAPVQPQQPAATPSATPTQQPPPATTPEPPAQTPASSPITTQVVGVTKTVQPGSASAAALSAILGKVKNPNGAFGKIIGAFLGSGSGVVTAPAIPANAAPTTAATAPTTPTQPQTASAPATTPNKGSTMQFGPRPALDNDDSKMPAMGTGPNDIDFSQFHSWKRAGAGPNGSGSTKPRKVNIGGETYYVKKAGANRSYTADSARNEVNANKFLRLAGINAPESKFYETPNGEVFAVTKEVSDAASGNYLVGNLGNKKVAEEVVEAYPIMDLMYNTDILQNEDNAFLGSDGHPIFLDNGSTFGFSAQGDRDPVRKFGFDYDSRTEPDPKKNKNGFRGLADFHGFGGQAWKRAFTTVYGSAPDSAFLKEAAKYRLEDLVDEAIRQNMIPKQAVSALKKYAHNMDSLSAPHKVVNTTTPPAQTSQQSIQPVQAQPRNTPVQQQASPTPTPTPPPTTSSSSTPVNSKRAAGVARLNSLIAGAKSPALAKTYKAALAKMSI